MGMADHSNRIRGSVYRVIEEGKYTTRDISGKSGTKEFVNAIIGGLWFSNFIIDYLYIYI